MDLDEQELKATRKLNGASKEIEVGEYVRTKQGNIAKVIEFRDELILDREIKFYGVYRAYLNEDELENITKHSNNILDLIENTDILQVEISEEWVVKEDTIRFIIVGQTYTIEEIKEALENGIYKIKKILTKEQYFQNCFRLEE